MPYSSGNRYGMQKIKNYRSADCVVGGFRYNEGKRLVGSLLLGLYDKDGKLNHVGFTSNIPNGDKPVLTAKVEKLIAPPGFTGKAPGGPSRWSTARSAEWQPINPKLVVEVRYDHFSGDRFRHGTSLLRFRPDKSPRQCTMNQVTQKADLVKLLFSRLAQVRTGDDATPSEWNDVRFIAVCHQNIPPLLMTTQSLSGSPRSRRTSAAAALASPTTYMQRRTPSV